MIDHIGLVINPIAGVGAELAWKGTDDVTAAWEAVDQGERQPVWEIVRRALSSIRPTATINWVLGGSYDLDLHGTVVHESPPRSSARDTHIIVRKLVERGVDLIIFAGGDGTAADVARYSENIPIIGIPAGVKIFSPCFIHRPEDLGTILGNWDGGTMEVDILDLDEEAYRQGQPRPKLITSAIIPISSAIQLGKMSWSSDDTSTFELIAERISEEGWLDQTILVGPGSTMKNIFAALGMEVSLLGVDIVQQGEIILFDATTDQLRNMDVDEIWLSPIGHQGHILGRGNRQIPIELLRGRDPQDFRIFSSVEKIRNTPTLYIDSGDTAVDKALRGYYKVVVGYHEEILRRAE